MRASLSSGTRPSSPFRWNFLYHRVQLFRLADRLPVVTFKPLAGLALLPERNGALAPYEIVKQSYRHYKISTHDKQQSHRRHVDAAAPGYLLLIHQYITLSAVPPPPPLLYWGLFS